MRGSNTILHRSGTAKPSPRKGGTSYLRILGSYLPRSLVLCSSRRNRTRRDGVLTLQMGPLALSRGIDAGFNSDPSISSP